MTRRAGTPKLAPEVVTVTIIEQGMEVVVCDALGAERRLTALSGVETEGHDFPVVWVDGNEDGERIPWPAESVRPA